MKVAVSGATGFVGRHLVAGLLQAGHDVVALSHRRDVPAEFDHDRCVVKQASVDNPQALASAFDGCDAVYHLVGLIVETREKTFDRTVARGTRNVVEACRQSSVGMLVYLSALGTSADAKTKYHRTKYIAEQAVSESGLNFIIYRPSLVHGDGDGFVSMLVKMIRSAPVVPILGHGRYPLQPVYIDDLVRVMVAGLATPDAQGKVIDVGGPEVLEYRQILDILKGHMGKQRWLIHMPLWIMRPAAAVLETFLKPAPLTRDQILMLEMGNTGDNSLMTNLFGIQPVSFREALEKYLR